MSITSMVKSSTKTDDRVGMAPLVETLTFEVLPSSSQQLVEDVEGPLVFGLADGSGLLQQVWG